MLHQVKAQGLNPLKMGNLLHLKDHLTNKMSLVLRNGRLRLLQDQIPLEQHLQEKERTELLAVQREEEQGHGLVEQIRLVKTAEHKMARVKHKIDASLP